MKIKRSTPKVAIEPELSRPLLNSNRKAGLPLDAAAKRFPLPPTRHRRLSRLLQANSRDTDRTDKKTKNPWKTAHKQPEVY